MSYDASRARLTTAAPRIPVQQSYHYRLYHDDETIFSIAHFTRTCVKMRRGVFSPIPYGTAVCCGMSKCEEGILSPIPYGTAVCCGSYSIPSTDISISILSQYIPKKRRFSIERGTLDNLPTADRDTSAARVVGHCC